MEIIIQATDNGLLTIILAIGVAITLFGVILAAATDGDALPVGVAFTLLGFVVGASSLFMNARANEQAQENFIVAAAEQLNIENPTPLENDEVMGTCQKGGKSAVSQYLWLDEDGEFVEGLIMRSPEQNGECVFTLRASS